jgi:hypothetical protein
MSNQLDQAERYRYLANESRRLAANDPYTESQTFHLQMAELYSTLAEARSSRQLGGANRRDRSDLTGAVLRTPRAVKPKGPRGCRTPPPLSARHHPEQGFGSDWQLS